MAKQIGDIILVGTIDDITFYKMDGKGYARKKTSLTGKRVKRDPRFQGTMQSAHRLGRGSQLASKVYRSLPRPKQVYALFKELKSIAVLAIKEGKSEAEVLLLLQKHLMKQETKQTSSQQNKDLENVSAKALKERPSLFQVNKNRRMVTDKRIRNKEARRKNLRWRTLSRRCRVPDTEAGHTGTEKSMMQG